ncbi:MAG TPA: cytochrome c oxidase assembly protein [Streptosporangiaceae bacterium]|nr:cytochrome c oxidase assembly protein [Streptosporangiaceae bacterium]
MNAGWRRWLAFAGLVLVVVCLVPPVATLARRYVFAESVQFVVFAMAAPALVVLGAPWRALRVADPLLRYDAWLVRRNAAMIPWSSLVVYIAICTAWRTQGLLDALATSPWLVYLEAAIVLLAGGLLWVQLVDSPPLTPHTTKPQRAVIAAVAMWWNWAVAYALGFAIHAEFHAYDHVGRLLGPVADQEVTVGLVWAVAGVCFVPVVFVALFSWLNDDGGPDEELARASHVIGARSAVRGWGRRPARGPQPR